MSSSTADRPGAADRALTGLAIGDPAERWRDVGFVVDDDVATVGSVALMLGSSGRGVTGWAFDPDAASTTIDGIPTVSSTGSVGSDRPHPNTVIAVDHVVVRSPDVGRTAVALVAAGFDERRRADTDSAGNEVDMRFFMAGRVVIELVGPSEVDPADDRPARLWGLAFSCADLDRTAELLGDRVTTPRDAVQPGRRICAVRRDVGLSVPVAFMSPHVRR